MSLPFDELSPNDPEVANWDVPDSLGRPADFLTDYERGGVALNDPSEGLAGYLWRARYVGSDILLSQSPYTSESVLLTIPGITELSLSFDQNMRPAVAYVVAGQAYLYWYNSVTELQETWTLPADIKSPFLSLDDKRDPATTITSNDTLLFYIKGTSLYYRQQRERYVTERLLKTYPDDNIRIGRVGMSRGLRMQIQICYITEPTPP